MGITPIKDYYESIYRSVDLLNQGDFNGLVIVSKTGFGKSYVIDQALKELKSNYTIFKGEISEAKFFEFLQEHSENEILVFRDMGKLLRRSAFIDTLKNLTEPIPVRTISRSTYAKHEGVEETFDFKSKIIIELNEIGKKYKEDIDAIKSRGLFIELNFSYEDITNIMFGICKNEFETEVTKYLIESSKFLTNATYNLRTQNKCIVLANSAVRDKLDWKSQIDLFLKTQVSEIRKLLYRFTGLRPVKRIEFIKWLMMEKEWSYVTTQNKVSEFILIGEIYTNGLRRQALISIEPIKENV